FFEPNSAAARLRCQSVVRAGASSCVCQRLHCGVLAARLGCARDSRCRTWPDEYRPACLAATALSATGRALVNVSWVRDAEKPDHRFAHSRDAFLHAL